MIAVNWQDDTVRDRAQEAGVLPDLIEMYQRLRRMRAPRADGPMTISCHGPCFVIHAPMNLLPGEGFHFRDQFDRWLDRLPIESAERIRLSFGPPDPPPRPRRPFFARVLSVLRDLCASVVNNE